MPEASNAAGGQIRRFNQEQYERLKSCASPQKIDEWNGWRQENADVEIELEDADMGKWYLARADLAKAHLRGAKLRSAKLGGARLEHADLHRAGLRSATLTGAELEGTDFRFADMSHAAAEGTSFLATHLEDATLTDAKLEGATFDGAFMDRAKLNRARMAEARIGSSSFDGAVLDSAHLENATIEDTSFAGADLGGAYLTGTRMVRVNLEGAQCHYALVSGSTILLNCRHDGRTDFTAVGLRGARVDPALRAALERNIRRLKWDAWYPAHKLLRWPVHFFWYISDYGYSTRRLIKWFFIFAVAFAGLYCIPGLVEGLYVKNGVRVPGLMIPVRSFYFSVVTMTTLGFGDIHAAVEFGCTAQTIATVAGHVVLTLQVLLGYVLLGALVTRLAVLFQEA